MKAKIVIICLCCTLVILAISMGVVLNKPGDPVAVGKVFQDSNYCGTWSALDECDTPVTWCEVIVRYAGVEGTAEIAGQTTHWNVYLSNGPIIDRINVNEDGIYSVELDWRPEEVYTGYAKQQITAIFFRVEIPVPQGFSVRAISSDQIKVNLAENARAILAPSFLISH